MIYKRNSDELELIALDKLDIMVIKQFYFVFENREKPLFVIDENENYLGFVTCDIYKNLDEENSDENSLNLFQLDTYCVDSYSLESYNIEQDAHKIIPIVQDNRLIYCYFKKNPYNIENYKYVLSVFPYFASDFVQYMKEEGVTEIYFDAPHKDVEIIKGYLDSFDITDSSSFLDSEFTISNVVILKCPNKLRTKFYASAKIYILEDILAILALRQFIPFLQSNQVKAFFIEGPNWEKLNYDIKSEPYLRSGKSLERILSDKDYMLKFCRNNIDDYNYMTDTKNGLLAGNRITYNGVNLLSATFTSDYVNVNTKGERKTILSTKGTPVNHIYIYGSCLSFGLFARDEETFPSCLQNLYNRNGIAVQVVNKGVKGRNNVLNDIMFAMNTPVKAGDTLVIVHLPTHDVRQEAKRLGCKYHDFNEILSERITPHTFLNSSFHANKSVYKILAEFCYMTFSLNLNVSPIERSSFAEKMSIKKSINQDYFLSKVFIEEYIDYLKSNRFPVGNKTIGSAVITANPLTLGHTYLIDCIARECDYFYIFVIDDPDFDFQPEHRLKMVSDYCARYKHGKVFQTGHFFGAAFLFPEYHLKAMYNESNKKINNPELDTLIFAKKIAPILGITRRYLGEEPVDKVTCQYNSYLLEILPEYGIDVKIISRFRAHDGQLLSGSYIRRLILQGTDAACLSNYLPKETIDVIKERNDICGG